MNISIIGLGWLGLPLAQKLISMGHQIIGSCRSSEKSAQLDALSIKNIQIHFPQNEIDALLFADKDIVFINIPPSKLLDTYAAQIQLLANECDRYQVSQLIFVSSTSVFGDVNGIVDENTLPAPDSEVGKLLLQCENICKNRKFGTYTLIRPAGLIGENRHPGKWFAGKNNIPNGEAPVNLISLNDCIDLVINIMENKFENKIIHAVSQLHPSRADFYTQAVAQLQLAPAHFIPELLQWKIVSSLYQDVFEILDLKY